MSLDNLNNKQKEAVLADNKRLLILAGAGSGKTNTLIEKLLYLLSEKRVKAANILVITFARNATGEIIERLSSDGNSQGKGEELINNMPKSKQVKAKRLQLKSESWLANLTVKTFHALCYQLLRKSGGVIFDNQFRLLSIKKTDEIPEEGQNNIAPEKSFDILQKMLIEQCQEVQYLIKLKRYILDFYVDKSYLDSNIRSKTYPDQVSYTTLKGEKVKSKSERDIADWLFRHDIKYHYEPSVNFIDFDFNPDFFILQANLYLEHVSDKSYPTRDKEEQFIRAGKNYVKTFEGMMHNSALFDMAMTRILRGLITDTISLLGSLKYDEEFRGYHDKIKAFLGMVTRVQSKIKIENVVSENLLDKAAAHQHERVRIFYELADPVINAYKQYCINKSYLDFDDLIINTIQLLEQRPEIRKELNDRYKYVLVDEFQDVNHLQVKLLQLLLMPDTQLFCVGDDWQSIYSFRGSEIDYIVNFGSHFKPSRVIKLDINYRSNQTIVDAGNAVIKHNKHKVDKEINAYKKTPGKIQVYPAKEIYDGVEYLVRKVEELKNQGIDSKEILVLYRRDKMYDLYREGLSAAGLTVNARTIHSAKGMQAKSVFIIGLKEGSGGFPDIWLDDAVFRVIKDVNSDALMEEERRLFYVALSRAKEELFLITQLGNHSRFIDEIPRDLYVIDSVEPESNLTPVMVCENCKTERKESYNFCPNCGNSYLRG